MCQSLGSRTARTCSDSPAGRLTVAAVDKARKGGRQVLTDVGQAKLMAAANTCHTQGHPPLGGVGSIPDAKLVGHTDPTAPECTPDSIPIGSRRVTRIEIKFRPDTLPGAQLERARTQHKALVGVCLLTDCLP